MIVKESDAHLYWCPWAFIALNTNNGGAVAVNRDFEEPHQIHNCRGSKCMAWTPTTMSGPVYIHPSVLKDWSGWEVTNDNPDERGYIEISLPKDAAQGRCGRVPLE